MTTHHSTARSISVAQAAADSSFSEYEIRKAINAGELIAIKRGVRIAIPVPNLQAWLDALPKTGDAA